MLLLSTSKKVTRWGEWNKTRNVLQGVPTSLEYAKCNVLKLRKVCERSELNLQKGPNKKGKISNFNDVTGSKLKFLSF